MHRLPQAERSRHTVYTRFFTNGLVFQLTRGRHRVFDVGYQLEVLANASGIERQGYDHLH